jgi:hypothetical protein
VSAGKIQKNPGENFFPQKSSIYKGILMRRYYAFWESPLSQYRNVTKFHVGACLGTCGNLRTALTHALSG